MLKNCPKPTSARFHCLTFYHELYSWKLFWVKCKNPPFQVVCSMFLYSYFVLPFRKRKEKVSPVTSCLKIMRSAAAPSMNIVSKSKCLLHSIFMNKVAVSQQYLAKLSPSSRGPEFFLLSDTAAFWWLICPTKRVCHVFQTARKKALFSSWSIIIKFSAILTQFDSK